MIAVNHYNECIVFHLAKAYQKAHANLKKHLAPYGLTPIQYLVLEAIREEEGRSATKLGKQLVLDSATLSGVLDRLADHDWIIKETAPDDKRFLKLRLAEKAIILEAELKREREKANSEVLGSLSLQEQLLLVRLLKDLKGMTHPR